MRSTCGTRWSSAPARVWGPRTVSLTGYQALVSRSTGASTLAASGAPPARSMPPVAGAPGPIAARRGSCGRARDPLGRGTRRSAGTGERRSPPPRTRPADGRGLRASVRTGRGARPSRLRAPPPARGRPRACSGPLHTLSNHSRNTSVSARRAMAAGNRRGSGWCLEGRMASESKTTSPSSSMIGTSPCPLTSRTSERSEYSTKPTPPRAP